MNEIQRQIARARFRMNFQVFLTVAAWCLTAGLAVGLVGLIVPRIWALPYTASPQGATAWTWGWGLGSVGVAVVAAIVLTWIYRRSTEEAAYEIDHRFRLKERISSALALSQAERETEMGQALLSDAEKRLEQVEVTEEFKIGARWPAALPVAFAAAVAGALFLPYAAESSVANPGTEKVDPRSLIKKSNDELKKKLAERQERLSEQGLKEAEELLKQVQQKVDKIQSKENLDKKTALIELNDIKKQLADRKEALGDPSELKKKLADLKDIEKSGPGEQLGKALEKGDFDQAMKELKQLADKMKNGELTPEDQKKLAQQMQAMADKIKEMEQKHKEMKEDLKRQIEQKKNEGENEGAAKLQEQLDKLEKAQQQMDAMKGMAQKMEQAAQQMEQGNMEQAMQQMKEMGAELQEMQAQMQELESLDEIMDELSQMRDELNGENEGDPFDGQNAGTQGFGQNPDGQPGDGMGEGQGYGYRPEEETETGAFDTQVRGNVRQGEAVRTGDAEGPNQKGKTLEEIKAELQGDYSDDNDPLSNQRLPRDRREHAKEYFNRLREGG